MKSSLALLCFILSLPSSASALEFTLVSQNLNRFFDDHDDHARYEKVLSHQHYLRRIRQLVQRIAGAYHLPDVIALQEVENRRILDDVSRQVEQQTGIDYKTVLIEGNDLSGIDVGYLVKSRYRLKRISALFRSRLAQHSHSPLFARPPLSIDICRRDCLTIINVHLRSMRGLRSGEKRNYIREKRRLQAQTLARWINDFQHRYPHKPLIVTGDFNALTPSDRYVDVIGTIIGKPDQKRPRLKSPDLIAHDLINASNSLPKRKRYSYRYHRKRQQIDYLLISQNLARALKRISFSKIDYRFSDHAALKAMFEIDH